MSDTPQQFVLAGTVVHAFHVTQRGLALMANKGFSARVIAGTRIQLRTAGGQIVETDVKSIATVSGRDLPNPFAFLLSGEIPASSIPEGTEIWVLSNQADRSASTKIQE